MFVRFLNRFLDWFYARFAKSKPNQTNPTKSHKTPKTILKKPKSPQNISQIYPKTKRPQTPSKSFPKSTQNQPPKKPKSTPKSLQRKVTKFRALDDECLIFLLDFDKMQNLHCVSQSVNQNFWCKYRILASVYQNLASKIIQNLARKNLNQQKIHNNQNSQNHKYKNIKKKHKNHKKGI